MPKLFETWLDRLDHDEGVLAPEVGAEESGVAAGSDCSPTGAVVVAAPSVACIGPVTAATAAEHGVPVTVVATEHTVDGLVEALVSALRC